MAPACTADAVMSVVTNNLFSDLESIMQHDQQNISDVCVYIVIIS